jgi:tetratricopeptide (TPR) repeat protein
MLEQVRKVAVNLAVIVPIALVAYSIGAEVKTESYSVDAISVPDDFAKAVHTKEAVASALRGEIGTLVKGARTDVAVRPTAPEASIPNLSVAGTSVPLRYVAGLIRDALHRPYKKITGEILPSGSDVHATLPADCMGSLRDQVPAKTNGDREVRLTLTVSGSSSGPFFDCIGPYSAILKRGAQEALKEIDPYVAATLLSKNSEPNEHDQLQPRHSVLSALAEAKRREFPIWLEKLLPTSKEIVQAHLALGNIYLRGGDNGNAFGQFVLANQVPARRSLLARRSHAAQDGISIVLLNLGNSSAGSAVQEKLYANAERFAKKALRLKPDYDVALFHLAESYDLRARLLLRSSTTACDAVRVSHEARSHYARLSIKHPRFAAGYDKRGTMLLELLQYLRDNKTDQCLTPVSPGEREQRLQELIHEADDSFRMSTLIEPRSNADSWLQWGVLHFAQQEGPTTNSPSNLSDQERLGLLQSAVEKFEKARKIKEDDFNILLRLGQALVALHTLSLAPDKPEIRRRAIEAFCRAASLEPQRSGDSLDRLRKLVATETECAAKDRTTS